MKRLSSRERFIKSLCKNKNLARNYYQLKSSEFRFKYIDFYSYDNFISLIKEIDKLKINYSVLREFKSYLQGEAGRKNEKPKNRISRENSKLLIRRSLEGKPFILNNQLKYHFFAKINKINQQNELNKLHLIWGLELRSLLVAKSLDYHPNTLKESLSYLDNLKAVYIVPKLNKLFTRLKINEKMSVGKLKLISKDLRFSLKQKYADNKDRKKINKLSDYQVIIEYFDNLLPPCKATREWKEHLLDFLNKEKNNIDSTNDEITQRVELEFTFLDKHKDFFRALRFADSANNCFNSRVKYFNWVWHKGIRLRENPIKVLKRILLILRRKKLTPLNCIARINKDPLAFIADLKEKNSNYILGFVFGRIGINPETKRPVVMISGIYAQQKNPYIYLNDQSLVSNILKIIEETIAKSICAEALIIPKLPNDNLHEYTKYRFIKINLQAISALSNRLGLPLKSTFDDIGDKANGIFEFQGYLKKLSKYT